MNYLMKRISIFLSFGLLLLILSGVAQGYMPSSTNLQDPLEFAESYMAQKLQAVLEKDTSLIDEYFNTNDKISIKTKAFEQGRLEAFIHSWDYQGIDLVWYSREFKGEVVSQEKNKAHVNITYTGQIKQADTGDMLHYWMNEPRDIYLIKSEGGGWTVQKEDYIDEFIMSYGREIDFDLFIQGIKPSLDAVNIEYVISETYEDVEILSSLVFLNRSRAIEYALKYSSNSSGDDSYNKKFTWWATTDCQNFVSQCYWNGFGGEDNQESINAHLFPMIDLQQTGIRDWWCDKYRAVSNGSWSSCSNFYNMITNNFNNDLVGLRGAEGNLGNIVKADYLYITSGHVWFINDIIDHNGNERNDWNEIYVCAHTANRRNYRIVNTYPSGPPTNMKFMKIANMKKP